MLGRCKTCSNQINFKALSCPKCGDDDPTYIIKLTSLKLEFLPLLFILGVGLYLLIYVSWLIALPFGLFGIWYLQNIQKRIRLNLKKSEELADDDKARRLLLAFKRYAGDKEDDLDFEIPSSYSSISIRKNCLSVLIKLSVIGLLIFLGFMYFLAPSHKSVDKGTDIADLFEAVREGKKGFYVDEYGLYKDGIKLSTAKDIDKLLALTDETFTKNEVQGVSYYSCDKQGFGAVSIDAGDKRLMGVDLHFISGKLFHFPKNSFSKDFIIYDKIFNNKSQAHNMGEVYSFLSCEKMRHSDGFTCTDNKNKLRYSFKFSEANSGRLETISIGWEVEL